MNNKEKVVLYAVYDEGNLDYSYDKEESLKRYCETMGYEVVKVFRGGVSQSFADVTYDFLRMSHNYRYFDFESFESNFTKLICYDLKELCSDNEEIVTLATITKENGIAFETIMQGSIGSNLTYTTMISENIKNEIKENKEFVVEDDPF